MKNDKLSNYADTSRKREILLDGYIEESDLAAATSCTTRTWQRRRQYGVAPPHVKIGRRVFYRVAGINEWLIQNERGLTSKRTHKRALSHLVHGDGGS